MLKTNLPDSIVLPNGAELFPVIGGCLKGQQFVDGSRTPETEAKRQGLKYRHVEVLSRNLRGKHDLHGQPYRPTQWVFVEVRADV